MTERNAGQDRAFAAPARQVFDAARVTAVAMGYSIERAGAAQGELDAVSRIGQDDRSGNARQVSLRVRLRASEAAGGTEMNVRFTEIIESASSNRASVSTESPLRDTPQYGVFFRQVTERLATAMGDADLATPAK